jgi:prepilin-type N-terminal cleavage/methylation domain-containing protein
MKNPNREPSQRTVRRAGFTLIELLTVIAIIAILAGLTAVAVPQYLAKAQETKTKANMSNVVQAIAAKSTEVENVRGYPPAYGYVRHQEDQPEPPLNNDDYVLEPYTARVGIHGAEDVYQVGRFLREGHDLDGNGTLSLFEYQPVGERDVATGNINWSDELYTGSNTPLTPGGMDEVAEQFTRTPPYVYVPFNRRQLDAVRRYWIENGDEFGESLDQDAPQLAGRLFFPPSQYDGFVLIGNGPGGNNGGVVTPNPPAPVGGGYDTSYVYHIHALRIAFLATRDLNDDRLLDFNYEDRKQSNDVMILPDGTNGFGAFIEVVQ